MTTENIDIRIREDGSRVVRRSLEDIASTSDRTSTSLERINTLLSAVGKFLAVRELMRYADAWSAATSSIKIATKTTADAILVQDQLFAAAQRARQEFGAMAELYAAVARQSDNLNVSQSGLIKYTENIAKALAIQHTSMEAARGPLLQLGQAMGSGVIRAQEFNSIMLGLPYVMKVVAENFKGGAISVMQLRQVMLDGKLTSKDFFDAFQKGTSTIEKDMAKTQVTFGQSITIFKNELTKFTGTMDSSTGASAKFAVVLKTVADNLGLLMAALGVVGAVKFLTPMIERAIAFVGATQAATAAQVAQNLAVVEAERVSTAAALASRNSDLAAAQATATRTAGELAHAKAQQATFTVLQQSAMATLNKANADLRAAEASLVAARNAGALSYALAVQRESLAAIAVAEAARSATLTELAALGQAQARVTLAVTAAQDAQIASTRALAVAQGLHAEASVAATAAQTATAAAVTRTGIVAGTASLAIRGFSGVVALMGGPIGVAIAALAGLAMWLVSIKNSADDAKAAIDAMQRIRDAKAGKSGGVRESDAATAAQNLTIAQRELEALEDRGKNIAKNEKAQSRYNESLVEARAKVKDWTDAVQTANDYALKNGGAVGKQAAELTAAKSAWEGVTAKVKTARTVQEDYDKKVKESGENYKKYVALLESTNVGGVNNKELERARIAQADTLRQMEKDKIAEQKSLEKKGVDTARKTRVKADAFEETAIIQQAMNERITIENQAFQTSKRLLDLKHSNGVISEAQYQAENLRMVQDHEDKERAIIAGSTAEYIKSYEERRKALQGKLSGQAESDALTRLDADYKKFTTSANASLAKLDNSAFERQQEAVIKLNGEVKKLNEQNQRYWQYADAQVERSAALAEAQERLANADERTRVAEEARIKVGETHGAQIERLRTAYEQASSEAAIFQKNIDLENAGQDTLIVLGAMIAKAGELGITLEEAGKRVETLQEKAAQAAVKALESSNMRSNMSALSESITTSLFEGGQAGGKKLRTWLISYFAKNPLNLTMNGVINAIGGEVGGTLSSIAQSFATSSDAMSGASKALGLISNASTAWSLAGAGGVASSASFGFASGVGATIYGNTGAALTMGAANVAGTGGATAAAGAGQIIGAIAPYAVAALVVANMLGLFKSKTITDTGVTGTLAYKNNDLSNYTETRKGGSLISGPKYSTATSAMDPGQANAFQTTVDGLYAGAIAQARAIGLSTDSIANYTKAMEISTKGLNDEQIAEKFKALFADLANELANNASNGISENFGKAGETAAQTLSRLANSLQGVNGILDSLGQTTLQVSMAGAVAASGLVDAFGTLQNMQQKSASYLSNYYSESERAEITTRQLTTTLGGLGYTLPETREGFRALVEQQDLYTASGQATYAILLSLESAFAGIRPEIEKTVESMVLGASELKSARESLLEELFQAQNQGNTAALRGRVLTKLDQQDPTGGLRKIQQDIYDVTDATARTAATRQQDIQLMELAGNTLGVLAAKRADELAQMDPLLRAKQELIYRMQDEKAAADALKASLKSSLEDALGTLKRSVDAQKDVVTKAYNDSMTQAKENADALAKSVQTVTSMSDKLKSTLRSMVIPGAEEMSRARAKMTVNSATVNARAGNFDAIDQDELSSALGVLANLDKNLFATQEQYAIEYGANYDAINNLSDITGKQKTVAEKQLDAANLQIVNIQKNYDNEIARLDAIAAAAQAEVDAINGVNTSILSLIDAINKFNNASKALGGAGKVTDGTSAGSISEDDFAKFRKTVTDSQAISQAYRDLLGREADFGGQVYWEQAAMAGSSIADIIAGIKNSEEYKGRIDGSHKTGIANVPFDGYTAELHRDERVLTAAENSTYEAGDGSADVVIAVNKLTRAFNDYVTSNDKRLSAIVDNTGRTKDVLTRAENPNGGLNSVAKAA